MPAESFGTARERYPLLAVLEQLNPHLIDRSALAEIDRLEVHLRHWRQTAGRHACALETVLDNEPTRDGFGLRVSSTDLAEAEAALNARIALMNELDPEPTHDDTEVSHP